MKRQLAFLLARAQVPIEWLQPPSENADRDADVTFQDDLPECLSDRKLSVHFKVFGKEVGVVTPRVGRMYIRVISRTPVSGDLHH